MIKNKKCIFMYVSQGFSLRYLVRSDILKYLLKEDFHIVLLAHNANEPGFRERYESSNVSVEKYDYKGSEQFLRKNKLQRILVQIRSFVINRKNGDKYTTTLDDFRKYFLYEKGWINPSTRKPSFYGKLFSISVELLKGSALLRKILIDFESIAFNPKNHSSLFEKYSPDLLIVTALAALKYNEFFAREAKKFKVPVCSVILSWDNTTGLGMRGYHPDHVIAWTDNMKNELVNLHDIPKDKVTIGGVAHWDSYYSENYAYNKSDTYNHFGLNKDKKTLVYMTKSPKRFPWGPSLVNYIAEAIEKGVIEHDVQLLVRVHPLHFRRNSEGFVFQEIIDEYKEVASEHACVVLNLPNFESKHISFDVSDEETRLIASMLTHSSVMLNMFSTMVIEAAIHDLPSINMSIQEVCKGSFENSRQDIMTDFNQVHNRRTLESGGVKTVFTLNELYSAINDYLDDPTLDREGRKRLAKFEAGPYHGNAGRMIANQISDLLS